MGVQLEWQSAWALPSSLHEYFEVIVAEFLLRAFTVDNGEGSSNSALQEELETGYFSQKLHGIVQENARHITRNDPCSLGEDSGYNCSVDFILLVCSVFALDGNATAAAAQVLKGKLLHILHSGAEKFAMHRVSIPPLKISGLYCRECGCMQEIHISSLGTLQRCERCGAPRDEAMIKARVFFEELLRPAKYQQQDLRCGHVCCQRPRASRYSLRCYCGREWAQAVSYITARNGIIACQSTTSRRSDASIFSPIIISS